MKNELQSLLLQRCQQLSVSLGEVAKRAGITRSYLHRLCQGQTDNPGIRTLNSLAHALQVPPSAIYRQFQNPHLDGLARRYRFTGNDINAGGAGSMDVLVFVQDMTVPDHTPMLPRERFRKAWMIQNAGAVPWTRRRLVRIDDEIVIALRTSQGGLQPLLASHLSSLVDEIEVPTTLPGQVVELAVEFAAPDEHCSSVSVWRMVNAAGQPCFGRNFFLQAVVTVTSD